MWGGGGSGNVKNCDNKFNFVMNIPLLSKFLVIENSCFALLCFMTTPGINVTIVNDIVFVMFFVYLSARV